MRLDPMIAKYAAAYLRRSYATEGRPGDASEATQLEAVQRMCGSDVTVYKDWGMSGRRSDRPDYLRLQEDIRAGRVASVCAYSLSRLGRSTRELLDFVALCRDNDVTLRTSVESLDTSGSMGRLLFTIMAAVAEFEADVTGERMAGVRNAAKARAEAAGALYGGKVPGSIALYGYRNVKGPDGVIRREPDPEHPIEPVIAAYREKGTLTGAAKLLNEQGIASPKTARTGKAALWGSSTLARVLRAHDATLLPDRGATGKQRPRPVGQSALFRGLLRCHCGRLMTPNVARKQYRCSAGNDKLGAAAHGRFTVSESSLKAALWPEAARAYQEGPRPRFAERSEAAIRDLQARRDRLGLMLVDEVLKGIVNTAKAKAEAEAIDAKLEKLERQRAALIGWEAAPRLDLNGDPAEQNALLRKLWLRVDLDRNMAPTVEWIMDPDALRKAEDAAIGEWLDMAPEDVALLSPETRETAGTLRAYDQAAGDRPRTRNEQRLIEEVGRKRSRIISPAPAGAKETGNGE